MIDRILEHLGLWEVKMGLSTKVKALPELTTASQDGIVCRS
jgi:hypothetical protein